LSGGSAAFTALIYTIFSKTGSSLWVAAALLLTFGTAGFVSPIAGAIGDRFDRKRVMICSDLVGAFFFFILAFMHQPAALIGVAFFASLAEAPFWPASSASIPAIVEKKDLGWANGLLGASRNMGILLGPVIGGVLVATIGYSWVFGLDALSFVISACIVGSVHARFKEDVNEQEEAEHKGMKAGFVFLIHDRVLRHIALAWMALTLGLGLVLVADVPLVKDVFGAGSVAYGILIAVWGGASAIGSLTGRYMKGATEPLWLICGVLVMAIFTGAIAFAPWLWLAVVVGGISGVGDAATLIAEENIRQRRTPDAVRSRVVAASMAGWQITFAISFVIGGFAVAALGPRAAYLIGGIGGLVAAAVIYPIVKEARVFGANHDLESDEDARLDEP
jgi:MFS family permease